MDWPPLDAERFACYTDQAREILNAAASDPRCDWSVLEENERIKIAGRCERLFKYFSSLPPHLLSDVVDVNDGEAEQYTPDPNLYQYVLMRYKEKQQADFEAEFDIDQDHLLVALMCGIWAEKNKEDVDFVPICDAANLDLGTYNMVKQYVRETLDDVMVTPEGLIQAVFCTPADGCVTLTMAYAELQGWPLKLDWNRVTYPEVTITQEEIAEFDRCARAAVEEQFKTRPVKTEPVLDKMMSELEEMEKEFLTFSTELHDARKKLQTANEREEEKMRLIEERDKAILDLMPKFLRDQPKLTDEMLNQLEEEITLNKERLDANEKIIRAMKSGVVQNLRDKLEPHTAQFCLALSDSSDDLGFKEGLIMRRLSDDCFEVRFLESSVTEKVNISNMALIDVPMHDASVKETMYLGLRVLAYVHKPYVGMKWLPGTVGAMPSITHEREFSVFLDDDFEVYVGAPVEGSEVAAIQAARLDTSRPETPLSQLRKKNELLKMFPMCGQAWNSTGKGLNLGEVHKFLPTNGDRKRFFEHYFLKYPDWPLVRMKKPAPDREPQIVTAIDRFSQRQQVRVVHVDRALAVLRFPTQHGREGNGSDCSAYPCREPHHTHNDELIFRGSSRISSISLESFGKSNMSSRRMAKNRKHFDVVEPDRGDDGFVVGENTVATARKTGMDRDSTVFSNQTALKKDRQKRAQKLRQQANMFSIEHRSLPLVADDSQSFHEVCTADCLQGMDKDPYSEEFKSGISPLLIPLLCAWKRKVYEVRLDKTGTSARPQQHVIYLSPCGRTFKNGTEVAPFLRDSCSQLTIDLFSFDPTIDPSAIVEVPADSIKVADYSNGLEHLPIPAVNTFNEELPPAITYGTRRFALDDRVNISTINPDFCSGCSCEGDCSDASRCECQQLTESNHMRLDRGFRGKQFGYEFRTLAVKTLSGVFECNDNCGCNRKKCFNRVVQNHPKYPLHLFKTAECGWGVRTRVDIPKGAFIANYVGAILTDEIAEKMPMGLDEYFANLDLNDCVETNKVESVDTRGYLDIGLGSSSSSNCSSDEEDREYRQQGQADSGAQSDEECSRSSRASRGPATKTRKSGRKPATKPEARQWLSNTRINDDFIFKWSDYFGESQQLFVIDAKTKGNIGRFLNHHCDPNVEVQHVLVDTHDLRLPWSAFFAARNIKAGEELCWDYGYCKDELDDHRPARFQLHCRCGAANCKGRLL